MITFSTHAKITGDMGEVRKWAKQLSDLVKQIAKHPPEVSVRVAGGPEVFVVTRFDSMADLEKQIDLVEGNTKYQSLVKVAADKGYFDTSSIQHGMWKAV